MCLLCVHFFSWAPEIRAACKAHSGGCSNTVWWWHEALRCAINSFIWGLSTVEAFVNSAYCSECVQSTMYPKHTYKHYMFLFKIFVYLFVYFCLCWLFVAAHGLSLVVVSRGYSLVLLPGLLTVLASLDAEHGLSDSLASVTVMHTLTCPAVYGVLVPRPGTKPLSTA